MLDASNAEAEAIRKDLGAIHKRWKGSTRTITVPEANWVADS